MRTVLFLLLFVSFTANSQIDYNKSISIPALDAPKNTPVPTKETDLDNIYIPAFGEKKNTSDKWRIDEPEGVTFGKQGEKFTDSKEEHNKKLNKKAPQDSPEFAKKENIHYGTFTIHESYIILRYLDYGNVDGDKVKIVLNDKTVYESITLYGEYNEVSLPMEMGINKLEIYALNEGLYSPNTAKFQVYELKRQMISGEWALLTGFKAIFIINRIKQ